MPGTGFCYAAKATAPSSTEPSAWPAAWTWNDGPGGDVPPWPVDWDYDTIVAADGPYPPGWSADDIP